MFIDTRHVKRNSEKESLGNSGYILLRRWLKAGWLHRLRLENCALSQVEEKVQVLMKGIDGIVLLVRLHARDETRRLRSQHRQDRSYKFPHQRCAHRRDAQWPVFDLEYIINDINEYF